MRAAKSFEKIVIRTPNWLGDLMMSTAFIKEVMNRYPNAEIDLIVKKGLEKIPLPCRGKMIPFDKTETSIPAFAKRLREEGYDCIFVLPPSFSSALMAFLAGIPVRIGYAQSGRSWFLKPARKYRKKHRSQHLITEYLQLLDDGPVNENAFPCLNVTEEWIDRELAGFKEDIPDEYIILAPGAMYGPAKQWPITHYQRLAALLRESSIPVLVIGTAGDFESGETIVKGLDLSQNICGKTGLTELIALMAKASLLVSNDSGAMHIMAALQKPQIALFGSTSTTWTGPMNPKAVVIREKMACSPCFQRECPLKHYDCLNKISPEQVADRIKKDFIHP